MIRIFNQYVSPKSLLLIVSENALIALSLVVSAWIRFRNDTVEFDNYVRLPDFAGQILLVIVVFQVCFYYSNLYDAAAIRRRYQLIICLGQSLGAASLLLGAMYYVFPSLLLGRGVFFIGMALTAASVVVSRVVLDHAWRLAARQESLLILGDGDLAAKAARELLRRDDLNVHIVGFISRGPSPEASSIMDVPILGTVEELESVVAAHQIKRIVVALEDYRGVLPIRELVRLRVQGIRVDDVHSTISALNGRVWLCTVKPSWFVFSDGFHRSQVTMNLKRAMDLLFAVLGLCISLPVMFLAAIAISLESKGPIIYRQVRVGLGGKTFEVLKFRSMRVDAEQGGAQWAKVNDPRVTRLGRFLRTFRLDELPQFINVIRGQMSFVGPRPERPVFVEHLRQRISYYDERHSVRPGLTGWAQVQYPYGATEEDAVRKLEYDLFYLKNLSIFFDCAIVLQTIRTVFTGKGAR